MIFLLGLAIAVSGIMSAITTAPSSARMIAITQELAENTSLPEATRQKAHIVAHTRLENPAAAGAIVGGTLVMLLAAAAFSRFRWVTPAPASFSNVRNI